MTPDSISEYMYIIHVCMMYVCMYYVYICMLVRMYVCKKYPKSMPTVFTSNVCKQHTYVVRCVSPEEYIVCILYDVCIWYDSVEM